MVKDTVLMRYILNGLVAISIFIMGNETQFVCRILPSLPIKHHKRSKIVMDAADELEEMGGLEAAVSKINGKVD